MKINKANCTHCAEGTIDRLIIKGHASPTVMVVHYAVGGHSYELRESIKRKSKKIKLGFLTVGQKRVSVLGNTAVGSKVRVLCNPDDPAEAYLPDNLGKANI